METFLLHTPEDREIGSSNTEQENNHRNVFDKLSLSIESGKLAELDKHLQGDANKIRFQVHNADVLMFEYLKDQFGYGDELNRSSKEKVYDRFQIGDDVPFSVAMVNIRKMILADREKFGQDLFNKVLSFEDSILHSVKDSQAYQLKEKIENPNRELLDNSIADSLVKLNEQLGDTKSSIFDSLIGDMDKLFDIDDEGIIFKLQRQRLKKILDDPEKIDSAMLHIKQVTKLVLERDSNAKVAAILASMHDWFKHSKDAGVELGLHELSSGVASSSVMGELVDALKDEQFTENKEGLQLLTELVGYTHGEDEFPDFVSASSPIVGSEMVRDLDAKKDFKGSITSEVRRLFGSVYIKGGKSTEVKIFQNNTTDAAQQVRGWVELVSAADKMVGNNFDSFIKYNHEAPVSRLMAFDTVEAFINKSILMSYLPNLNSPSVQKWFNQNGEWQVKTKMLDNKITFMKSIMQKAVGSVHHNQIVDSKFIDSGDGKDTQLAAIFTSARKMTENFKHLHDIHNAFKEHNLDFLNKHLSGMSLTANDLEKDGKINQMLISLKQTFDADYQTFMKTIDKLSTIPEV